MTARRDLACLSDSSGRNAQEQRLAELIGEDPAFWAVPQKARKVCCCKKWSKFVRVRYASFIREYYGNPEASPGSRLTGLPG